MPELTNTGRLRKGDVVICDTRYWYGLTHKFDPLVMTGIINRKPMSDTFYMWVDIGFNDPWPFDEDELTKIGRL